MIATPQTAAAHAVYAYHEAEVYRQAVAVSWNIIPAGIAANIVPMTATHSPARFPGTGRGDKGRRKFRSRYDG
jgi:hypothetical protein